jgi:hypothetical protein
MLTRNVKGGRLAAGAIALMLAAGLACPSPAAAGFAKRQARKSSCPGRQTIVRVDSKTCSPTKHRPLIVLKRACCRLPHSTKIVCKNFGGCPPRSPS